VIRYQIEFRDGSQFGLYGEEYFGDKAVFWRHHQAHLIGFSEEVCVRGRPVALFDHLKQLRIPFGSPLAFDQWFHSNQSKSLDFGFSELSEPGRIQEEGLVRLEEMVQFLENEIGLLRGKKLDPWRIDGGYRALEHTARLGALSLEIIFQDHPHLYQHPWLKRMKEGFEIPTSGNADHPDLISYAKSKHEDLDKKLLLELCLYNLVQIRRKIDAIQNN
jgi:hypothetical protein